jgi:two-component system phosphate regulon sensor histidine kinase PhoR
VRKGIFRRNFLLYALVVLAAIFIVELYITSSLRESYIADLRKNLLIQISLIRGQIRFSSSNLDALCEQFKQETGARVTVIAANGRVIGDSDRDSSSMDNHLNRTEVEQASLYDSGMAIRRSDTLLYDLLYVARKISSSGSSEGFIRLAVPLKDVDRVVNMLRLKIIVVVVLVLLATWLFSVWQTDHLRRLLKQITDFSKSLSKGDLEKRLFLRDAGEFNEIAENLTMMSITLQGMMTRNEEEKNRLNVILKSIPDALLIIDAKGTISLSSSSAKEFFGDIPMAGMQFVDVVRNHELSGLIEEVRSTLSPGTIKFSIEYPSEKYLGVRVSPLFYHGSELSGLVAVFHDMTQAEKLEQVRKDFVANVSHELKTPITAIRGFADTLLEGALEDRESAVRFIETIRSNSERINSIVDDLMTISKIELGVIKIEEAPIDISLVFEDILELFIDKAAAKNIELIIQNKAGVSEVSADRDRLMQILTNLVDNAIKFTEKGRVTFGIDRDSEKIFLFIEDTGIGVPGKYLPRLGERFFRVDPARSRKMGGTGLGLAIVKHLVKAHGWNMHIESTLGKGTKVQIIL